MILKWAERSRGNSEENEYVSGIFDLVSQTGMGVLDSKSKSGFSESRTWVVAPGRCLGVLQTSRELLQYLPLPIDYTRH